MQAILDFVKGHEAQAINIIQWIAGLGIVDVLLRKIPTEKPKSILLAVRAVLGMVYDLIGSLNKIIDSIPGMAQVTKPVEQVEEKK